MKPLHWGCVALVLGAGALFWWGTQVSGGLPTPEQQRSGSRVPDDLAMGYAGSHVHLAPAGPGNVYLPHRYPNGIGENLTALINYGLAPLRIPTSPQFEYFVHPPSEAVL